MVTEDKNKERDLYRVKVTFQDYLTTALVSAVVTKIVTDIGLRFLKEVIDR